MSLQAFRSPYSTVFTSVAQVKIHPEYVHSSPWANDIALLRLVQPAPVSSRMHQVCLPPPGYDVVIAPLDYDLFIANEVLACSEQILT